MNRCTLRAKRTGSAPFQRVVPDFEPGPEMLAERQRAVASLTAKVARLGEARLLRRGISVDYAVAAFQAMCEGLANLEMRGAIMRMLPEEEEEETWRVAMTALIRGLTKTR